MAGGRKKNRPKKAKHKKIKYKSPSQTPSIEQLEPESESKSTTSENEEKHEPELDPDIKAYKEFFNVKEGPESELPTPKASITNLFTTNAPQKLKETGYNLREFYSVLKTDGPANIDIAIAISDLCKLNELLTRIELNLEKLKHTKKRNKLSDNRLKCHLYVAQLIINYKKHCHDPDEIHFKQGLEAITKFCMIDISFKMLATNHQTLFVSYLAGIVTEVVRDEYKHLREHLITPFATLFSDDNYALSSQALKSSMMLGDNCLSMLQLALIYIHFPVRNVASKQNEYEIERIETLRQTQKPAIEIQQRLMGLIKYTQLDLSQIQLSCIREAAAYNFFSIQQLILQLAFFCRSYYLKQAHSSRTVSPLQYGDYNKILLKCETLFRLLLELYEKHITHEKRVIHVELYLKLSLPNLSFNDELEQERTFNLITREHIERLKDSIIGAKLANLLYKSNQETLVKSLMKKLATPSSANEQTPDTFERKHDGEDGHNNKADKMCHFD